MDNLLDPAYQDQTQPVVAAELTVVHETATSALATEPPAKVEDETTTEPQSIEEIDTGLKAHPKTPLPRKAVTKPTHTYEEVSPNPLLLDPYEWDRCAITVGYSLMPDNHVSISVHNHKDEPIVKEFPAEDVPLPEKISGVMATLQSIWPTSPVNTTVVLLPKPDNAPERPIIVSVRVSTDTPIVQEGVESNLPFPTPIVAMLEELKALIPERALKKIQKNSKPKAPSPVKAAGKSNISKPATSVNLPTINKNINKDQLTLF